MRAFIKFELRQNWGNVITAKGGEEALQMLKIIEEIDEWGNRVEIKILWVWFR